MAIPFTHVGGREIGWYERNRNPFKQHSARMPVGNYELSIQHADRGIYCDERSVEIAVFYKGEFVKDFENGIPHSDLLIELFSSDYVAGWVTVDVLEQVINELERVSK